MKIFTTKQALNLFLSPLKEQHKTIGFVPTMGALHKGHLSLVKKARKKNNIVVVSIFVNPTQFDNNEDLTKYPKTLEKDKNLLQSVSCDVLFMPSVKEIYDENITSYTFDFGGLEHQMEGEFRKGHFNGVGTVVKKLFEIIKPNTAYFGQKDYQQLQIVKKMVKKYHLPVKIKGCPIFRENSGLAMSSRNARLSKAQTEAAAFIYKILKKVRVKFAHQNPEEITKWVKKEFKQNPLLTLEYFTIANQETLKAIKKKNSNKKYRAFIAVFAGKIRLIDNIKLKN